MKKRLSVLITLAAACVIFASCEILKSTADQISGLANLANCEYSLKNVSNLTIAGVNVKSLTNGKVSASDVINLSAALLNKKVPMSMDVNIDIKNPTEKNAALTAITINKLATTTVPLGVNTDLYSMFSKNGIESLKNFIGSFKNDGTSSKVGLRIKPSLNVGGVAVPMPNYINVEKKTGGSKS